MVNARQQPLTDLTGCACEEAAAQYTQFDSYGGGGCDETDGRYADVGLLRCRTCRRLWLRYFVEYEAFTQSGRWARGLISEAAAATITPETALAHLDGLEWYLYGGSYYGSSGRRRGAMHWGL
ncbi:MAG: hypothetical protein Q8M88_00115 [Phenylobacterium sp.]|uniref:hypothetical protein n=1 Tax=Phenylobacterium sp. TaxID=1871053 RepID=UPI0027370ADF|nr:hypothetical protein [Phenylobacterium sp.]MDP3172822.1 hypothetical protein [Phenylobacterium sp.]